MSDPDVRDEPGAGSALDRLLGIFGDVRPGESATVLLMLANIFVILVASQIIKTVREPLILATGGAEVKSYSAAGQALALMGFIPLYSWFASRVDRGRLAVGVTLFFIVNIELFYLGALASVPYLGVLFYVWVGIFNNAVIAQFWSYANDVYSKAAGERLFPLIAIGMTGGSPAGPLIAATLFERGVRAYPMLHVPAALLALSLALYLAVDARETRRAGAKAQAEVGGSGGGFSLVFRSEYLRLVALLIVVLNLVNTTGEYILDLYVTDAARSARALDASLDTEAFIGGFKGRFFFGVNVASVLIQALLVSRIVKYLGLPGVLLAGPVVAFGAYGLIASGVGLVAVRWAKTAENANDYSVMNTGRALLWLPTTREEKYKAKQTVDTFFVRIGDVLSALFVFVGTSWLGLGARGFASANLGFAAVWLLSALLVIREYRALAARQAAAAA
jgi:AAA family ATP:ADP antiporter